MQKRLIHSMGVVLLLLLMAGSVLAQDVPSPETVTLVGTLQDDLGCDGEWDPTCEATMLTEQEDGTWQGTFDIPAGTYSYKVTLDGTWDVDYGVDGTQGGDNIQIMLAEDSSVTMTFDPATGITTASIDGEIVHDGSLAMSSFVTMVNIPGTLQPALGCESEWAPDCPDTALTYNETYDVWMGTFTVPAGSYEYKVALNGNWGENYGAFADRDGANIGLTVPDDQDVTFIYDHKTNWISDSVRHAQVVAVGDFQDDLGCESDTQADCLITWLQDVDGDGIYVFNTTELVPGDYTAQVAPGMSMAGVIGADGMVDGEPMAFTVNEAGTEVAFLYDASLEMMAVNAGGATLSGANLRDRRSHWVLADTIAWYQDVNPDYRYRLLYSEDASIRLDIFGLTGNFASVPLTANTDGLPQSVREKFPHLAGFAALNLEETERVPHILKQQFAVAAYDAEGNLVDMSGLQIPGVLDDLYTYDGDLGVTYDINGIPLLTVWAPTARDVTLLLFDDTERGTDPQVIPMTEREDGTWRAVGLPNWRGKYYQYQIDVFAPTEMAFVVNEVTDPYSISLSENSSHSQIVDLNSDDLKPEGWDTLAKPDLESFTDISIYELHVRDFSALDESVPEDYRGTYMAFTVEESSGREHLAKLVDSGLTHLHLLPTFDIATINENRDRWFYPDYDELAVLPPDSDEQQAIISDRRDMDPFNWGYDPFHFNVPEGSYSTDPEGTARIVEYREMVKALNEAGLRVVQDVVYNHTNASGQAGRSVLDKVVPGYYHRLDARGQVATSTCCQNTATEHNMMRRLMVDSVMLHATQYKVDGFRFDLMGHHMLADMQAVRAALDSLTLEEDGVDGSKIYVYGEGWNFGEVQDNARGINATQLNIGGTGIGVFNDRLRDGVRGGNPVDGERYLEQGLGSGIVFLPTDLHPNNGDPQRALLFADWARIGLAGNLREYTFTGYTGETVTGAGVDYNGSPAGYTLQPQENIVYVSAHDNETLYDNIILKAPRELSVSERMRLHALSLSFVTYAQGVPFFHAGSEMMRSKSLDRDSYNSGDWFNYLDFTYQTNNFGVGLPPAHANSNRYEIMRPLLAESHLQPTPDQIEQMVAIFREMLDVRYSTPLFRLETAEQIQQKVGFHNTGAEQTVGMIVMSIDDRQGEDVDPAHDAVVVIFNTRPEPMTFTIEDYSGMPFAVHPVLAESVDDLMQDAAFDAESGTFIVPPLATAVYVLPQS